MLRLVDGEGMEIHPWMLKKSPPEPVTFAIPRKSTRTGNLTLQWRLASERAGNGTGCEISEIWLMKA